jgi:hypothetical protein
MLIELRIERADLDAVVAVQVFLELDVGVAAGELQAREDRPGLQEAVG